MKNDVRLFMIMILPTLRLTCLNAWTDDYNIGRDSDLTTQSSSDDQASTGIYCRIVVIVSMWIVRKGGSWMGQIQ